MQAGSNPAQVLFATDQVLGATPGVGVAATTGQTPITTVLNGGGSGPYPFWRWVPTNYDAVYPAGTLLSPRYTTTASTGSINNAQVSYLVCPVFTRGEIPYYTDTIVTPGVDF
jgi:hypothetical protein